MNSAEFSYKKDSPKQVDEDLMALKKINTEMAPELRLEQRINILQEKINVLTPTSIAEDIDQFESIIEQIAEIQEEIPGNNLALQNKLMQCKVALRNIAQSGIMTRVTSLIEVSNDYHTGDEKIRAESTVKLWRAAKKLAEAAKAAYLITNLGNNHAADILTPRWIVQLFEHSIKHGSINIGFDDLKKFFSEEELAESKDTSWQLKTRPKLDLLNVSTGRTKKIVQY